MKRIANILQIIKKVLLKTVSYLVLLVLALFVVLQLDVVQTYLAKKMAIKMTEAVGHEVGIDKVSIRWFDLARIEGVSINDLEGKEMLYVESAMVDYHVLSLLDKKQITLDYIEVYRPHLFMTWYKGEENINFNIFLARVREKLRSKTKKKKSSKPIFITSGRVIDGKYAFDNVNRDSIKFDGFDHFHFRLDSINGDVSNLYIYKDTVQLEGRNITALYGKKNFHIYSLNTDFRYTKHSMSFSDINTDLGSSHLSKELLFSYDEMSDFQHFNTKVKIEADLDSTVISTQDLAMFAPGLKRIKDHWTGHGKLKGRISNFESKKLTINFGKRSRIHGEVGLDGIPNIAETFIEFDLQKSILHPEDVRQYLSNDKHYPKFQKFGRIDYSAKFYGFPSKFATMGTFETELGYIKSDIQFEINKELGRSEYDGKLLTKEFQLGDFLDNEKIGTIDMDGEVKGYGFTIDQAELNMAADVHQIKLLDYTYKNIEVNGDLKNQFFDGDFEVKDENLALITRGKIDFREGKEEIMLQAKLDKANLQRLKITEDSAFLSTQLDVDFKGFNPDNVIGVGDIKNTLIHYNQHTLAVDDFKFSSFKKDSIRDFSVKSNLLGFDAKGNFKFRSLAKDMMVLLEEYQLKLSNDQNKIKEYYANKWKGENYQIQFELDLLDTRPLFELFVPELDIAPETILTGRFSNSNTSVVEVHTLFDSLRYDRLTFFNNEIDFFASKKRYSNEVLASYYVGSEHQKLGEKPIAKEFDVSGLWDQRAFTFGSNLASVGDKNGYHLNGDVSFLNDSTVIQLYDSDFKIDNKKVSVTDTNIVGIKGPHIVFEDFKLLDHFNKKTHELSGDINSNDTSLVTLSLDEFDLNYVSLFARTKLQGTFTGDIRLSDFYKNPKVSSDFVLKDFSMLNGYFGDFEGNVNWDLKEHHINLDVDLLNKELKLAEVSGFIDTDKSAEQSLNLLVDLNDIPIDLIEPFMQGNVSHMQGNAKGQVRVEGDFVKPNFYGEPEIKNGGFTIEYLKTHYVFDDKVFFNEDKIEVKDLVLVDTLSLTSGKLNGYVRHSLFRDFYVNIQTDLNKTLLQNTKKGDNEMYYGTIYATGRVNIEGPFEELVINSDEITSEKGTTITIPLDSEGAITTVDFIHFVDKDQLKDDFEVHSKGANSSITGITINFNMNITEDALIDIIFDEKAGDKLTGYGKGLMLVDLSTKGDFNMYGNYEITKGNYSFSMLNLLNKSFSIKRGSQIVWNGDPYQGKMDVTAKYSVLTNVVPIINDTLFVNTHSDVKRSNPVDVFLGMKGNIMSPEIKFDIDITEYPNYIEVEQAILDFKNRIKYNEQELNKQVFSLMVLKKLSPLDDFEVGGIASTAGTSVSEMFTNQLGSMLSQLDEDLDVYIDLGNFETEGQSVNVRLTYSVLDGRLKISHNGNYSSYEDNQDLKNLFGEWTVEYLISDDGKVRIKGYNKLNQNTASTSLSSQNSTVYGVSLAYNDNFDSFNEFWNNLKDKFRRKEDEEEEDGKARDGRLENLGL